MADNQKPPENPNDIISFGDFFPPEQSVPIETEEASDDQSSRKGKGRLRQELEDRGEEKVKEYAKEKLGLGKKGGEELGEKAGGQVGKEGVEEAGEQIGRKIGGKVVQEGAEKIGQQALKQGVQQGAQLGAKLAATAGEAAAESSTGVGAVVAVVQVAAAVGDIATMPIAQMIKGEYEEVGISEIVLAVGAAFFLTLIPGLGIILGIPYYFFFGYWLSHSKGSDKSLGITRLIIAIILSIIPGVGLSAFVVWSIMDHNKSGGIGIESSDKKQKKKPAKPKVSKK
jgi:hypothetical protein